MPKIEYEIFEDKFSLPIFFYDTTLNGELDRRNWHDFLEILYSKNGECEIICDQNYIPVKPGEICLMNPNSVHSAKSEKLIRLYSIGISCDFCNYNGINIQEYKFEQLFSDKTAERKLKKLHKAFFSDEQSPLYLANLHLATLDLLLHIINNHTTKKHYYPQQKNINYSIGYIRANFNKKITVDDVCNQAGLSKAYFSREFKKLTGTTIVDYINFLRCNKACTLLKTKQYTVKEVFQSSCFESMPYFTNVFKKHIGVTPSEYLKRQLEK